MRLRSLIAYDGDGNVVGTLGYMVALDEAGEAVGLIDFAAHEEAGGEMTDVWIVDGASGSKTWPEWLGSHAHDFRVELEGPAGGKRIGALVHKESGHRRERAAIESAIEQRIAAANGAPADIRDLVGGPDRPIHLDEHGRSAARPQSKRPNLPLVAARERSE